MDRSRFADGKIINEIFIFGRRKKMEEFFWVIGFVVIWLLLQLVILPKLGVST